MTTEYIEDAVAKSTDLDAPTVHVSLEKVQKKRSRLWMLVEGAKVMSPLDYIISTDLSALWRRHLVWAKKDGNQLLDIVVGRYGNSMVFMSLLFGAAVGTYFSPSGIVTGIRTALEKGFVTGYKLEYATGVTLQVSIILTGSAVFANFTAWGVFRTIGKQNAPIILRCNSGLYAAQLPSRLTVLGIYTFFAWLLLFWWVNYSAGDWMPIVLTGLTAALLVHIVSTFSKLSRIIMATSCMGQTPILPREKEELLSPTELDTVLLNETMLARKAKTPVNRQYLVNFHDVEGKTKVTYKELLQKRHPGVGLKSDLRVC